MEKESTLTSATDNPGPAPARKVGVVNSPARRKPKHPVQHAAHSIAASWDTGGRDHDWYRSANIRGVTESLTLLRLVFPALRKPCKTRSSRGKFEKAGSGRPHTIWACQSPLRYTRIAAYVTPLTEARKDTKRHRYGSDKGRRDGARNCAQKLRYEPTTEQ